MASSQKTLVFATIVVAGFHRWKNAPDVVAFLRDPHRHLFHIKGWVTVDHADRDTEFFILKNKLEQSITALYPKLTYLDTIDFGGSSCEMIAVALVDYLNLTACEVSEDGENGALVTKEKLTL